jgi:signal transduction histidine kinase
VTIAARTRLAVVSVAAASVVLVALVLYGAWLQYTVAVRTATLSGQVYALAEGMKAGGAVDLSAEPPLTGLRQQMFEVEALLLGARLVLLDEAGSVRQSSDDGGTLTSYDIERLTGEPDERGVRSGVRPLAGAGRVIVAAAPVTGVAEDAYLVAVQPVRELAAVQRGGGLIALGIAVVSILGAWLIGGVVARRITAPVVRLQEGAEAIRAGSWGHQVPVEGDVEVASLARSFNEMSRRVDDAYTAQRNFVGDVSHELRTPITAIQGFSGALLEGMAADDAERERFLHFIRKEAGRLMELTGTLLALADLDSGRVVFERERIDTVGLAEALHARHDATAHTKGVSLDIGDLGEGGRPLGDELRVLQVASALVTNALAHTPSAGAVRVTGTVSGGVWTLAVDDSGPGIPTEQRERIFERFVRLDESRTAAAGGGAGLGLPICRRLVEAMGGTIGVEDSDLGGARFAVTLDVHGASA